MGVDESQNSSSLSDRELQIVELVAAGLTNQEIAEKLEISKRTVDNHISNILTKTATGNRVALVRWALQWGKVCLDEVNCCVLPTTGAIPKASSPLPDAKPQAEASESAEVLTEAVDDVDAETGADSVDADSVDASVDDVVDMVNEVAL
ncbi:Oxygen regulatory protein NreC [Leptolyngbya sp. O-77]|nr:Oxygen regulatory protein NreC [Leptolyngbya sp. O-77]